MISAAMLDAMVAAGCTAEQIAAVVKAALAEDAAAQREDEAQRASRRARDADRQRRRRTTARVDMDTDAAADADSCDVTPCHAESRGQSVTERDNAVAPLPPKVSPHTPLPNPLTPIPPSPPTGALPPRRAKNSADRGTRLPDDFKPDRDWAVEAGMRPETSIVEAAKFVDFWRGKAGPNGLKRDWPATWRNWVRRALEDARSGSGRGPPRRENLADYLNQRMGPMEADSDWDHHEGPTIDASFTAGNRAILAAAVQRDEAAGRG